MTASVVFRHAIEVKEGENVDIKRLMPVSGWMNFDPFILWDHFSIMPDAGLPDHSHRGFEAITYLFTGGMRHEDNLGNRSTVLAGGAQRFTAGRGITHSEMPVGDGITRGIQLWINLPGKLKTLEPDYQQVDVDEMPVRKFDGGTIITIVGKGSPMRLHTPVLYLDVRLDPGATLREAIPPGYRGLIYAAEGSAAVGGKALDHEYACFADDPGTLMVEAWEECRLLFCFGRPHREPIRQHGPFVD
jgi:quercetin 2,3-dioxygenase